MKKDQLYKTNVGLLVLLLFDANVVELDPIVVETLENIGQGFSGLGK